MKLKICGMKYPQNIQEVLALQPDFLGFIFYEKSKRVVEDTIWEIVLQIPPAQRVAVVVDAPEAQIKEIILKGQFQLFQLHGNESPAYCQKLKDSFAIQLIKAFAVDEDFDFNVTKHYQKVVDYVLFDTKGKEKGGNGVAFAWELLKQYDQQIPFFLSGGISLDNVGVLQAFLRQNPMNLYALDVNSRFELSPAHKDVVLLSTFVQTIRN